MKNVFSFFRGVIEKGWMKVGFLEEVIFELMLVSRLSGFSYFG